MELNRRMVIIHSGKGVRRERAVYTGSHRREQETGFHQPLMLVPGTPRVDWEQSRRVCRGPPSKGLFFQHSKPSFFLVRRLLQWVNNKRDGGECVRLGRK